ncbi:uncharacterized protein UTRI_01815_B [Ustilago trichophora]|uniref:C2H2-type domain-containing protein n=1 Tax=Ustilago trichophora TaxID=86804 RepID=A0A5C3E278_9BASI|nr:uncharacterized protein UTRI_01815_B [Ustilago trichophora]
MKASREWSASPIPDTTRPGHDNEKLDALQSAVMGAQSSLVSQALRMLHRSPPMREELRSLSGNQTAPLDNVRPPELATLDTPPSSCVISIEDDINDPLLKPPTVPSQTKRVKTELESFEEAPKPISAQNFPPTEAAGAGGMSNGPLCVGISAEWFLGHSERPALCSPCFAAAPSQQPFVELDSFPSAICPAETHSHALEPLPHGSYHPDLVKQENDELSLYDFAKFDGSRYSSAHSFGLVDSQGTISDLSQPASISDTSVASEDWSSMIDLTGAGDTPVACDAFRKTPSPPLPVPPLAQGCQPFIGEVGYQGFQEGGDPRMAPFQHPKMHSSTLDPFKVSLYHNPSTTVPPTIIAPKSHVGVLNSNTAPQTASEPSIQLYKCDAPSCTRIFTSTHELHSHQKAVHFPSTFRVPSPHTNTTAPILAAPSTFPASRLATIGTTGAATVTPLKCNFSGCAKIFSSMHNLNEHKQVHVSPRVRSYHCSVSGCGGRYFYKRDLQRHLRKKHPALAARLESCRGSGAKGKVGAKARLVRM